MCLEVFDELHEMIHLSPKFDMPIDGKRDDVFVARRADNIVDDLAVHEALLVLFSRWEVLKQQIVVLHLLEFA